MSLPGDPVPKGQEHVAYVEAVGRRNGLPGCVLLRRRAHVLMQSGVSFYLAAQISLEIHSPLPSPPWASLIVAIDRED